MFVCKYGSNQLFVDPNVPETFDWLKKLSNEKKLFCLGCGRQVIFRRCVAKNSHFAHLSSEGKLCDFEQYINAMPSSHKKAIMELKDKFANSNSPQLFVKLIDRHWTGMTVCVENEKVAIELLEENSSLVKIKKLKRAYAEKKINVLWLFVLDNNYCTYRSNYYTGINQFLQNFNYVVCLNPDSKEIIIKYKDKSCKSHWNNNEIFQTTISLDCLKINAKGKISGCIKAQYNEWKNQQNVYHSEIQRQHNFYIPSSNMALNLTYEEILHNVNQWINSIQAGAGVNIINAIRQLINEYPDYRDVYNETIQYVTDPTLKKKLDALL